MTEQPIYRIESLSSGDVRFARAVRERGEHIEVYPFDGGPSRRPRQTAVVVTEVTEAEVAAEFPVGARVSIRKYGGHYNGKVVRQGTKRVDVAFRTVGGFDKVAKSIPAKECVLLSGRPLSNYLLGSRRRAAVATH